MRDGFRAIAEGWMLRDDAADLYERIERVIGWAWGNGPLELDELQTLKMMMESLIARELRERGLGVPSL